MNDNRFGNKCTFKRGASVKICFQAVTARNKIPAINVDMARGISDWEGKETFQLTIEECSMLAAYFLKFIPEVNFQFHGKNNNRSLFIAPSEGNNNPMSHYVGMNEAGKGLHYIHLQLHEGFSVFDLLLKQLSSHYQLPIREVIMLLKSYYYAC